MSRRALAAGDGNHSEYAVGKPAASALPLKVSAIGRKPFGECQMNAAKPEGLRPAATRCVTTKAATNSIKTQTNGSDHENQLNETCEKTFVRIGRDRTGGHFDWLRVVDRRYGGQQEKEKRLELVLVQEEGVSGSSKHDSNLG